MPGGCPAPVASCVHVLVVDILHLVTNSLRYLRQYVATITQW